MGRDLLYKPPTPLVIPDEADEKKVPAPTLDKFGVQKRRRDLGGTDDKKSAETSAEPTPEAPSKDTTSQTRQEAKPARTPAFRAAYFTKDVEATAQVNQRTKSMRALRGSQEATDLKKVVLPASERVETPDPHQLRAAGELMGLGESPPELQSILQRQGGWLRQPHVTVEMLQMRLAQMEALVAARVQALARMSRLPRDRLDRSVTLARAAAVRGSALEQVEDLHQAGEDLTRSTEDQAKPMHRRIAKTLGIKLPQ